VKPGNRQALWERLRATSLVEGEAPVELPAYSPWYVRLMLGVAGWIGAFFLLGFVGVGFVWIMKSATASWVTGALLCAAATAIFRVRPDSDFFGQFGLAVSFAGQAMMFMGLIEWFDPSSAGVPLAAALQQMLLFVLVPNFIHRTWSAWSGAYAASFALGDFGLQAFTAAALTAGFLAIWLREFEHARHATLLRAGGYGVTLAAVQAIVMHGALWSAAIPGRGAVAAPGGEVGVWLGALASGAVLVWAVLQLLRREGIALREGRARVALGGALLLALVSLRLPGVGPAVAILVMGFANANRVLSGLGIVALLGYLSHYYYSLQATLLVKSALLASAGAALLLARMALRRWWPEEAEARHA